MRLNTLTISEIKRRDMSAVDDSLRLGPIHIVKRNKVKAVILSETQYLNLTKKAATEAPGMSAMEWLIALPARGHRSKSSIDSGLQNERTW